MKLVREDNGVFSGNNLAVLRNRVDFYEINGVKYEVYATFHYIENDANTISERVFRVVENTSAHLMADTQDDKIYNEYTCLTAREEDLCSQ